MLPIWFKKAVDLYMDGCSYMKIGKELNVDRKKVSKILTENGYGAQYSFKNKDGVLREFEVWRKYSVDENFFEVIDTEEKAYWLGFLYADGYVSSQKSSIELGLQEKDLSHIELFAQHIKSNSPISKHKRTLNGKDYHGYRLTINSQKIKNDLINKGCTENKSLTLTFPTYEQVPKNLMKHFIRGYVDGDGCYYIHKNPCKSSRTGFKSRIVFEVAGTEAFLRGMISELGLHSNKIHDLHKGRPKSKKINYSGVYAERIISFLYSDANVYLERKHEKIKNYLPSNNETHESC